MLTPAAASTSLPSGRSLQDLAALVIEHSRRVLHLEDRAKSLYVNSRKLSALVDCSALMKLAFKAVFRLAQIPKAEVYKAEFLCRFSSGHVASHRAEPRQAELRQAEQSDENAEDTGSWASKPADWRESVRQHWKEHCYKPLVDSMAALETKCKAYSGAVEAVHQAFEEAKTVCSASGIDTSWLDLLITTGDEH